jgi:hypothetical protein
MRRRDFVALLSALASVWPLVGRGQQKAMRTIGSLSGVSPETSAPFFAAFRSGLSDTGYTEGSNLTIEIAGRRIALIGCRHWQKISCTIMSK